VSWFRDRDLLTDGHLWAERESELKGETERMARELRDNLLGPEVWGALEPRPGRSWPRAKRCSAPGATIRRSTSRGRRWSTPEETELNALLFSALRKVYAGRPEAERSVLLDGRTLDLGQRVPPQSLGGMLVLLEKKPVIEKGVRRAFSTADAGWILGELPHALRRIVEIRNPAAHGEEDPGPGDGPEGRDHGDRAGGGGGEDGEGGDKEERSCGVITPHRGGMPGTGPKWLVHSTGGKNASEAWLAWSRTGAYMRLDPN
jgi:hypothetical protein